MVSSENYYKQLVCDNQKQTENMKICSNSSLRRRITYFDSNELDYRQENTIFQPALNGVGLTINVRGKKHEVDSIVDIKDVGLL